MDARLRARHGLSLASYDVLLELQAVPDGRLTMSDLGNRVVLSRTRVSRVVDDLARSGLVARETNPDDKRSAFATITPAGRAPRRGQPICGLIETRGLGFDRRAAALA
jgi:DNA-binding MarR family transcriptional regulator